ncbi:MAG: transcriptional regulator [Fibrobacterota bacterium]|nr:MAG: transcriptional regulator [Fibrobacterota bacterium]
MLRLAPGLYGLPESAYDEHHSLVLAQGQMPNGVICLLSALQFHGITSQLPREVWMAMEGGTHRPRVTGVKVRVSRFTGDAYSSGIETHKVEGGLLRMYSVTKTVIDCFRMRNKIGVDIAIEALRDALRWRKTTIGELESMAARLRARTILRPYLEMAAAS